MDEVTVLCCIDPGTRARNTGWAWFVDAKLVACGVGRWDKVPVGGPGVVVVIECPQVYRAARSKGDPNDMVKLAWVAGEIAQRARAVGSTVGDVDSMPRPATWKGSVKKQIMTARILATLTPAERRDIVETTPYAKDDNMIDACGIGLHRLGRLK